MKKISIIFLLFLYFTKIRSRCVWNQGDETCDQKKLDEDQKQPDGLNNIPDFCCYFILYDEAGKLKNRTCYPIVRDKIREYLLFYGATGRNDHAHCDGKDTYYYPRTTGGGDHADDGKDTYYDPRTPSCFL